MPFSPNTRDIKGTERVSGGAMENRFNHPISTTPIFIVSCKEEHAFRGNEQIV
jgi:hypothetical protein